MRLAYAFLVGMLVLITGTTAQAATKKYKVKVESAPPGATVYIDSKASPVGLTPWEGTLTKGTHTLFLELDGYEPLQATIKIVRSRKSQNIFKPLVKVKNPPKIDVDASADKNVYGATVYLDDEAQGTVPTLITTTAGKHQIKVKKAGYEDYEKWVTVKDDETASLNPVLKEIPKPKLGVIVVEADVKDAEVLLDNEKKGSTPIVINDVIEGVHVVEVRKEPAIPWKQTITVEANKQTKVSAELKATMGGGGGNVKVLSNVTGAHAFLDGNDMGEVPVDIKDVKTGEHVIEVRASGYQTREERVTVNNGSATVLKLDMNKEAKSEAKLTVVSSEPGADVYIDGALAGKTPATQDVSAGEHYVVVKLTGFKTFEVKVRVEAGQTRSVPADLKAVGKLRVLSDPLGATVLIDGIAQDKPTPLELEEVEVGDHFVRVEMKGREAIDQKVTIQGGKQEVLQLKLELEGMTPEAKLAEQRGLSSFGARTLPRGRSTIDVGIGYPYYSEIRVNVGASKLEGFGFDAGVGVRSFFARSELGLGVRLMMVNNDPFTAGTFSDLWWGSKLLDNSGRNGLTWNVGGMASLTALTHVTITGRGYFNIWSDSHCPGIDGTTNEFSPDSKPITACTEYRDVVINGGGSNDRTLRMEELTGNSGRDMFGRDGGMRFITSVVAEIAYSQNWSYWIMLEGAPFQGERALFTHQFSYPMAAKDYNTYARTGLTYKF
jgi:hypothetical protein